MKLKISTTILVVLCYVVASAQHIDRYIVKGQITGLADGVKIYLKANLPNRPYSDTLSTAVSKDGKFTLEGKAFNGNQFGFLKIDGIENHFTFIIDFNEPIYIHSTLATWPNVRIEGSRENKIYLSFWNASTSLNELGRKLLQRRNNALKVDDSITVKNVLPQYYAVSDSLLKLRKSFYDLHPDALYSAYLIQATKSLNSREKNEAYAKLTSRVKNSFWGVELMKRIHIQQKTESIQIGSIVPNFYSTSIDGKVVSLHEIIKKNKYTLIDFWASWCGPCREHTPNIKQVYKEFRSLGFNVLGVSFDFKAEPWKQTIKTDSMTWDHIADLKGRSGEAHQIFNLSGIPAYMLVNQKCEIIELDLPRLDDSTSQEGRLREDKLYRKIESLLSPESSFVEARKVNESFLNEVEALEAQFRKEGVSSKKRIELIKQREQLRLRKTAYWIRYLKQNPTVPYSMHLLADLANEFSLEKLKELYSSCSGSIKSGVNNDHVLNLIREREAKNLIEIGKVAPDFIAINFKGEQVNLQQLVSKNKVTLLDFWASWCKPCRDEIPNIKRIKNEFGKEGFDVISYSVDQDQLAWRKAIKDEDMNWYNIADKRGGFKTVKELFYVKNTVPATYLLDRNGKILAINLTGEQLYKRVSELLTLKSEHERK